MDFYVKIGEDIRRISRIIDEMDDLDVVFWNYLFDRYVEVGDFDSVQMVFDEFSGGIWCLGPCYL